MKIKKVIFFLLITITIYFVADRYLFKQNILSSLKDITSEQNKKKIKRYLFPYKYIKELTDIKEMYEIGITGLRKDRQKLLKSLSKKDELLSSIPEILGYEQFYEEKKTTFEINKTNFTFKEFKDDFLEIKKASAARSGSIYIDKIDEKIMIVSGHGQFHYFDKQDLEKKKFKTQIIKSNIKDIIKYADFYSNSKYGIKDLFIMDDNVYFSYIKEAKDNCFNTSILKARLNFEKLLFEDFFSPSECIVGDQGWFQPHSSGGRMIKFKDKIIFSVGEYLSRGIAQDPKSIFGKIVVLDPLDRNYYKLLSIGHRNVQGLFLDGKNKVIISTEHGPYGGDEININKNFIMNEDKINNYGWPISSYGEHYGCEKRSMCPEQYAQYPFYKSHKKYGYEEPFKYFVPSIGISQIIKFNDNFFSDQENNHLLVGALGNNILEGDMSLHYIKSSKDYQKIINHQIININSRVRDMIILDEKQILVTLETNSTIGVLKISE